MNTIFNNAHLCSKIKGFIQVGASIGEEIPEWERFKINNQIFIEPIHELFPILQQRAAAQPHSPNVKCYQLALTDHDGEDGFHISTGSFCSSSLLDFHKEATKYGQTLQTSEVRKVKVRKLDTFIQEENLNLSDYNLLYIDVQGSEYYVIKGAEKSISAFDMIFVEVNKIALYDKVVLWEEFNEYVKSLGFNLVDVRNLEGSGETQAEALYFRKGFQWR